MEVSKRMNLIIKIIMVFSAPFLALLLSRNIFVYDKNLYSYLIVMLLAFFTMIFLVRKIDISYIDKKILLIATIASLYIMNYFVMFSNSKINQILTVFKLTKYADYTAAIIGILSFPILLLFVYLFFKYVLPKAISFFKTLTKVEKKYLLIFMIIGLLVTIILSFSTTAFTSPIVNGYGIESDVIYTTDTYALVNNDAFVNISHFENDIRQPLFGIFALPFGIIARILSELLFFIPGSKYGFCLMFIQFILIAITNIMIGRILKLKESDKKYLYLLFSCSYPYMVFTITVEQYIIALFYLILSLYVYFDKKDVKYYYIGASGTLLTSGIIFPVISKTKKISKCLVDYFKTARLFFIFMVLSGQIIQLLYIKEEINHIIKFSKGLGLESKIYQFTNFVSGIFFSSKGFMSKVGHTSYQLVESNSVNIIGVFILVLMLISFILNRKEKIAVISFLWVVFSVILLCLIGWGSAENGLILYSIYFSWSYLILYYLLIKKLFKSKNLFKLVYYCSILTMGIFSIMELLNLLGSMISYY